MEEINTTNQTERSEKNSKKPRKKRIVLWIILGILALALIGGGIYVWHVLKRPDVFFDPSVRVNTVQTPEPTPAIDIKAYLPTQEPGTTPIPTAAIQPTQTPTEQPETDTTPTGIVNIALFGIDAYEDGSSTSGSMPHTDANMIVAINFDTKEVSLISIARDCMTTAPGYRGFYKFNGIFNVGGGMTDPKAGFALSCRAAEEWLGGISVPYYYGVDFQALIDLVDLIGGIDFDVDIKLYLMDGRRIFPGHRHLDGQGVMAYMRMRKTAGGLDSKRTARQRKMIVAIFKKLKQEGKLSMIPDLLKTMGDNVYTNTTLAQTAALANFAKDFDPDNIKTFSIQGEIRCKYDWAYCFIDQQNRLDIIKEVYGFDAEPVRINSLTYETFLHKSGFLAIQHLANAKNILTAVHDSSDTSTWTEAQKTAYAQCWQDYRNLQQMFDYVDQWTLMRYDAGDDLSQEERKERAGYYDALESLEKQLRRSGNALDEAFDNPYRTSWNRDVKYWYERDSVINEVFVDFR
ncbi:MAG: LCP family protein [Clostridia bacterium]|nr:LCP family protein [Clostridia bacterium]